MRLLLFFLLIYISFLIGMLIHILSLDNFFFKGEIRKKKFEYIKIWISFIILSVLYFNYVIPLFFSLSLFLTILLGIGGYIAAFIYFSIYTSKTINFINILTKIQNN